MGVGRVATQIFPKKKNCINVLNTNVNIMRPDGLYFVSGFIYDQH